MSRARETVLVAQQLFERLGPGAIGLAETRSEALREAGDIDGAQHWKGVSHAMICTLTGLAVSISGLYPVHYFQSRAKRETETLADRFTI